MACSAPRAELLQDCRSSAAAQRSTPLCTMHQQFSSVGRSVQRRPAARFSRPRPTTSRWRGKVDGVQKGLHPPPTTVHQRIRPLQAGLHAARPSLHPPGKPCRRRTYHAHLHRQPSSDIIVRCGNFLPCPQPQKNFTTALRLVSQKTMTDDRCMSPGLLASQQMERKRPFVQTLCLSSRSRRPVCPEPSSRARLAPTAARRQSHASTSRHSCLSLSTQLSQQRGPPASTLYTCSARLRGQEAASRPLPRPRCRALQDELAGRLWHGLAVRHSRSIMYTNTGRNISIGAVGDLKYPKRSAAVWASATC